MHTEIHTQHSFKCFPFSSITLFIPSVECFLNTYVIDTSVQFSHSGVSNSLQPHGLQHTRFPCPSPTPRAYLNSCLSCQWCHPTMSSSVIPFSSCLQSFPASESFLMSWFFIAGGQCIGLSASASGSFPMSQFFTSDGQSIGASTYAFFHLRYK